MLPFLTNLIVMLYTLFPLDMIYLSGTVPMPDQLLHQLQQRSIRRLSDNRIPHLQFIRSEIFGEGRQVMAKQVLKKILMAQ